MRIKKKDTLRQAQDDKVVAKPKKQVKVHINSNRVLDIKWKYPHIVAARALAAIEAAGTVDVNNLLEALHARYLNGRNQKPQ